MIIILLTLQIALATPIYLVLKKIMKFVINDNTQLIRSNLILRNDNFNLKKRNMDLAAKLWELEHIKKP